MSYGRRPRRSRYTAEMYDGEKKVVLAYSGAEATDFYVRKGFDVLRVTKGDHRKVTKLPTGARPNSRAIREACDFLGVALPVKVRVTSHQGYTHGMHTARPSIGGGWYHDILVKSWLTAEQMGATLWHELAHAMQFERDALNDHQTQQEIATAWKRAYLDGTSYRQKAAEVEARSYESHNDEIALAR